MAGHSSHVTASSLLDAASGPEQRHDPIGGATYRSEPAAEAALPVPTFAEIYEASFDFVWRSARRLGVKETHVDDVVQEVFMVVHRRLAEFEGRSQLKTWLFGITRRVVGTYHRTARRKPTESLGERDPAAAGDPEQRFSVLEGQAQIGRAACREGGEG